MPGLPQVAILYFGSIPPPRGGQPVPAACCPTDALCAIRQLGPHLFPASVRWAGAQVTEIPLLTRGFPPPAIPSCAVLWVSAFHHAEATVARPPPDSPSTLAASAWEVPTVEAPLCNSALEGPCMEFPARHEFQLESSRRWCLPQTLPCCVAVEDSP